MGAAANADLTVDRFGVHSLCYRVDDGRLRVAADRAALDQPVHRLLQHFKAVGETFDRHDHALPELRHRLVRGIPLGRRQADQVDADDRAGDRDFADRVGIEFRLHGMRS